MRKLFFLLIIGVWVNAQESDSIKVDSTKSERIVTEFPIYPGCKKSKEYKKATEKEKRQALIQCSNKKLNIDFQNQLNDKLIVEYAERNKKKILKSKIYFIINTVGKITHIKVIGDDDFMNQQSLYVFQKFTEEFNSREEVYTPAKYTDGTPVNTNDSLIFIFRLE